MNLEIQDTNESTYKMQLNKKKETSNIQNTTKKNKNANEHWKIIFFYFQLRESPAPLNIPTPIPAPDRGASEWSRSLRTYSKHISKLVTRNFQFPTEPKVIQKLTDNTQYI